MIRSSQRAGGLCIGLSSGVLECKAMRLFAGKGLAKSQSQFHLAHNMTRDGNFERPGDRRFRPARGNLFAIFEAPFFLLAPFPVGV